MAKSLDIINPKHELKDEEPESENSNDDFGMKTPNKNEGGGVFYLVLGIIAIVVATGAALYILYKDYLPNKKSESVLSTQTPTASTVAGSVSATTTSSAVSTATSFKYTNERIRVVNGNGISGEGAKVQKELESKGFTVESVGNASKNYSETIVYYKTGQEKLAEALKEAISSLYSATIENSDTVTGNYDAVIALGSK